MAPCVISCALSTPSTQSMMPTETRAQLPLRHLAILSCSDGRWISQLNSTRLLRGGWWGRTNNPSPNPWWSSGGNQHFSPTPQCRDMALRSNLTACLSAWSSPSRVPPCTHIFHHLISHLTLVHHHTYYASPARCLRVCSLHSRQSQTLSLRGGRSWAVSAEPLSPDNSLEP